ncbi:MAG: 5'/3'-nucleotidase SurE [Paramuribaculum sp.]|nr:5'/3'-nucleotidase SurE [Paramuribaculum sp.]
MNQQTPLILVTNDDGVHAPGLHSLIRTLQPIGQVIAVAPDGPRSGQASAITVETPLRINRCTAYSHAEIYSVNGTPVDCVKLAMHTVLPRRPDILVSGINHGSNSGNCVIYSGTMGAVIEACMLGIPAIGYSLLHHSIAADFSHTGKWIDTITRKVLEQGLPNQVCLNVNIPAECQPKGIKVCEAAPGHWSEEYQEYTDPMGRKFYMLTGHYNNDDPENPAYDNYWLDRQYISVVPVRPDQTYTSAIPQITDLLS